MTWLIISDLHDNLANLRALARKELIQNIAGVVCAGDLGGLETLQELLSLCPGLIYLVAGNADNLFQEKVVALGGNIIFNREPFIPQL